MFGITLVGVFYWETVALFGITFVGVFYWEMVALSGVTLVGVSYWETVSLSGITLVIIILFIRRCSLYLVAHFFSLFLDNGPFV